MKPKPTHGGNERDIVSLTKIRIQAQIEGNAEATKRSSSLKDKTWSKGVVAGLKIALEALNHE